MLLPIVLLTDFGHQDPYVGQMKDVILRHAPGVPIVDLCHEISACNVAQAAFMVHASYAFYPHLLSAEHIRHGALQKEPPDTLLVPGGWARLKSLALGDGGRENIQEYVRDGGGYFGICGGAGLALASQGRTSLLDLCSWSRKAARDRLPTTDRKSVV